MARNTAKHWLIVEEFTQQVFLRPWNGNTISRIIFKQKYILVINTSYMMSCGTSELFMRKSFKIFWYEEEIVCQSLKMIFWDIWPKSCQSAVEEQKLSRLNKIRHSENH